MSIFYSDDKVVIYHADFMSMLPMTVDLVVTDPPYGETSLDWDSWPKGWTRKLRSPSMWCFGSMRMFLERHEDFIGSWKLAQDIVWRKHNGSGFAADRFRRIHEHVLHFYQGAWGSIYKMPQMTLDAVKRSVTRKKGPQHTAAIGPSVFHSKDGGPRLMTSVIDARSCHGYAVHPTQKPVEVITPLIAYGCWPQGTVLDPFMGSGSTLVAARQLGRRAIGVDIDKKNCQIALDRLKELNLLEAA